MRWMTEYADGATEAVGDKAAISITIIDRATAIPMLTQYAAVLSPESSNSSRPRLCRRALSAWWTFRAKLARSGGRDCGHSHRRSCVRHPAVVGNYPT